MASMTAAEIKARYGGYDDPFADADPMEGGGQPLPEGTYRLKLQSVEVKESKKGAGMIGVEWSVVGGQCDGRKAFENWMLESVAEVKDDSEMDGDRFDSNGVRYRVNMDKTATCIGMLKGKLQKIGVNVKSAKFKLSSFLCNNLNDMLDKEVKAEIKHGAEYNGRKSLNINIQGPWEVAAGGEEEDTSSGDSDGTFDPFADE